MQNKIHRLIKKADKYRLLHENICDEMFFVVKQMIDFEEDFSILWQNADGYVLFYEESIPAYNIPVNLIAKKYTSLKRPLNYQELISL